MMKNNIRKYISNFKIIDLSHILEEGIPNFPTHTKYYHLNANQIDDPAEMSQILMHEHNGTHVDAPAHYIKSGAKKKHFIEYVNPTTLIGSAVHINLNKYKKKLVTKSTILKWEKNNCLIKKDDIVILNFGWHKKWKLGKMGNDYINSWPGLDLSSSKYLLRKKVCAVGTDTLGLDCCGSTNIPAHTTFLVNNILIMENLTNLDSLPIRFNFVAIPLKIKKGTASPLRALALVNK